MAENRYRKIEVRMWGDEKFRTLSPLPPSAQGLWLFLLTGPHTGPIPGLFRAGRAALAEELGWPQEAFDEAFEEVFRLGMAKADWRARVVWIPNAIKCNPPQSPNVVTSWAGEWHLIPECSLKAEAYRTIESVTYHSGEPFRKAFDKAFQKPPVKTLPNQEQEQEQEQESSSSEQESRSDQGGAPTSNKTEKVPSPEACRLVALLKSEILSNKPDYRITPAQIRKWELTADRMLLRDGRTTDQIAALIRWAQHDEFWMANILSMDTLREKFDQLEMKAELKSHTGNKCAPVRLPADYVPASQRIREERSARAGGAL
jgi:hypothetical protein